MATNEKEINNYLFDQLHMLRRIRKVAEKCECNEVLDAISEEESDIKEKLYQKPPLTNEG